MSKSIKPKKKEQTVKLNTSFEELVNMSVRGNPKPKTKSKNVAKKK